MTSNSQDGGHGVISRRKVLPSVECIHAASLVHMRQCSPVPILSTFILVLCIISSKFRLLGQIVSSHAAKG